MELQRPHNKANWNGWGEGCHKTGRNGLSRLFSKHVSFVRRSLRCESDHGTGWRKSNDPGATSKTGRRGGVRHHARIAEGLQAVSFEGLARRELERHGFRPDCGWKVRDQYLPRI